MRRSAPWLAAVSLIALAAAGRAAAQEAPASPSAAPPSAKPGPQPNGTANAQQTAPNTPNTVSEIVVTARRLNEIRTGIQTQVGASTYTVTHAAIDATPGGENQGLNQVVLQAPGVAQDSFGQLHIRGEHGNLQYRLNGAILPEGLASFGQTLNPRLAERIQLITGALPAEYGLRTAGIVDIATRSGAYHNGGTATVYGGSHDDFQTSGDYFGNHGPLNFFVSADWMTNGVGIESPNGQSTTLHDRTTQYHAFAYLEDVLDPDSKVSLFAGTAHSQFQIPNIPGQTPSLGLSLNGRTDFRSEDLNENQREITHFAVASYLRSFGKFDLQASLLGRFSSLYYSPDVAGELLFNGIAQEAYKRDVAGGLQVEGAYHLGDTHTIRGGVFAQTDRASSRTTSYVFPVDANGAQTSTQPLVIPERGEKTGWTESAFLQDEWKLTPDLTLNYGVRYDHFSAYAQGSQVSPRVNAVWKPLTGLTVHAGYARYFTPPPFELVGNQTVALFQGTTAQAPNTVNDTPKAERANYFDLGVEQRIGHLTLGVDAYDKGSKNLIDEGQFGAPIIQTPFNYAEGKQRGVEFSGSFAQGPWSAYANLAIAKATGKHIVSSQFNFDPRDLAYIATHFIPLDHDQTYTASAGGTYKWAGNTFFADLIYGSGLRADGATPNGRKLPDYTQVNAGVTHDFDTGWTKGLQARLDIINVFDERYIIRDGTGVGVGAPQYGPRRGFFVGLTKTF